MIGIPVWQSKTGQSFNKYGGTHPGQWFPEEDANTLLMDHELGSECASALMAHMEAHGVKGFPDVDGLNALVETLKASKEAS